MGLGGIMPPPRQHPPSLLRPRPKPDSTPPITLSDLREIASPLGPQKTPSTEAPCRNRGVVPGNPDAGLTCRVDSFPPANSRSSYLERKDPSTWKTHPPFPPTHSNSSGSNTRHEMTFRMPPHPCKTLTSSKKEPQGESAPSTENQLGRLN
ncbi:hypothetical protein BHE74_00026787 [Ensete ventricosum]|nr:hypothetical protein BHE74_00026787 [Ensete ventricosum]